MLGNPRKIEFKLKLSDKHVFRIKVLNIKSRRPGCVRTQPGLRVRAERYFTSVPNDISGA
jgi:hypothetical protein